MNFFEELMRIADKQQDEKDADILRAAAFKHVPGPPPLYERTEVIPGWGYYTARLY